MNKLIAECVDRVLMIADTNELTKHQLDEVLAEVRAAFDEMAIIPKKRKLSRVQRESLGYKD